MAGLISTVSIARVRLGYIRFSPVSVRFIIKLRLTHRKPSRLRKEPLSWPFMVWFQIRSLILKTLEHVHSSHIRPIYDAGKLWPGLGNNAKLANLLSWSKVQNICQLWFDTLSGYFGSLVRSRVKRLKEILESFEFWAETLPPLAATSVLLIYNSAE